MPASSAANSSFLETMSIKVLFVAFMHRLQHLEILCRISMLTKNCKLEQLAFQSSIHSYKTYVLDGVRAYLYNEDRRNGPRQSWDNVWVYHIMPVYNADILSKICVPVAIDSLYKFVF